MARRRRKRERRAPRPRIGCASVSCWTASSSMRSWRPAREANLEAFDNFGNAAHIHVERVARAERDEALLVGRAAGQHRAEFAEIVFESRRRNDLQNACGRV